MNMGFIFAVIFGFFVVENVNNQTDSVKKKEKTIQVNTNKNLEKNTSILEVKAEPTELEVIKKKDKKEPFQEEVKKEPIQEEVNELVAAEKTNWFKIVLYILGSIFVVLTGSYFYKRRLNTSDSDSSSDFMRKEFKDEVKPDADKQQPAEEEEQSETTEQQPAEDDEENNKK